MDINLVISLVSGVGTFFATILVLLTLLEMKNQRRNSMSPDLVFSKKKFYLFDKLNGVDKSFYWLDKNILDIDGEIDHNYSINANNIGMGAAKNVNVRWEFNVQDLIQNIKELDHYHQFEITFSNEKNSESILTVRQKDRLEFFSIGKESSSYYEYILSSQVKDEAFLILLPDSFIRLISFYLYLNVKHNFENIHQIIGSFPELKMSVSYYDISGSKYKKDLTVCLKFYQFSQQNTDDSSNMHLLASGTIEFCKQ